MLKGIYRFLSNICSHTDSAFIRKGLASFSKKMFSCTLRPLQQQGFMAEESRCWTGLPAVQNLHPLNTFGTLWMKNMTKKTQDCWAARILYRTRLGTQYPPKLINWSPQFLDLHGWLIKEDGMMNIALSQRFWDVLLPSNSKLCYFLKVEHLFYLNIWCVFKDLL